LGTSVSPCKVAADCVFRERLARGASGTVTLPVAATGWLASTPEEEAGEPTFEMYYETYPCDADDSAASVAAAAAAAAPTVLLLNPTGGCTDAWRLSGRDLHSSTFRLNVSAFCGIGGALRGSLRDTEWMLGRW
jgi:hypothetical protein